MFVNQKCTKSFAIDWTFDGISLETIDFFFRLGPANIRPPPYTNVDPPVDGTKCNVVVPNGNFAIFVYGATNFRSVIIMVPSF